jgi:phosphate butyryltransferase
MHIQPSLKEKAGIISNAVFFMRVLGVDKPKVAVLAAIETVNEAMKATTDASMLAKMSQRGQLKNCIVEGPLAFDNAISREHALHKGIIDEVSGDPDILLAPDIETAGVLYQSLVFFGKAKVASISLGASCPIVLTAGIDSPETRLNSIMLAACLYD